MGDVANRVLRLLNQLTLNYLAMAEANENYVLFYNKNSKLFSVNGGPQKGWAPRSRG